MIDKARIQAEADAFFEWPGADKSTLTTTSALIFCSVIAEMVRKEASERIAELEAKLAQPADPVAMIEFIAGVKEPRIMSWNQMPPGQHRLYDAPQPVIAVNTQTEREAFLDWHSNRRAGIDNCWVGWQARAALPATQPAAQPADPVADIDALRARNERLQSELAAVQHIEPSDASCW